MIGPIRLAPLAAAAALAVSLTPASATEASSQSAASITEVSSAEVPLPAARPAFIRKRVAVRAPARQAVPRQVAWISPRYDRVVAHGPMLMLGIGF